MYPDGGGPVRPHTAPKVMRGGEQPATQSRTLPHSGDGARLYSWDRIGRMNFSMNFSFHGRRSQVS